MRTTRLEAFLCYRLEHRFGVVVRREQAVLTESAIVEFRSIGGTVDEVGVLIHTNASTTESQASQHRNTSSWMSFVNEIFSFVPQVSHRKGSSVERVHT